MLASPKRMGEDDFVYVHWSYVGQRAIWRRSNVWKPPSEPAPVFSKVMQACGSSQANPTEPDRIAALEQRVAELESTMRQLLHGSRFRLVVEPR